MPISRVVPDVQNEPRVMAFEPHTPHLVRRSERRAATGLPMGSAGEEAFADRGAWVGFLSLSSGAVSGWHHHGEWDSYACVQRGLLRWEYGPGGREALEIGPGDTARMPAGVVHRDVSAGEEGLEMILFRAGQGPLSIDVGGPDRDGGDAA